MSGDESRTTAKKLDHLLRGFELMFESVLSDPQQPPNDISRQKLRRWIEEKRDIAACSDD